MNKIFIAISALLLLVSCEQEFLSVKPSSNIIRPETLSDLELLLDNNEVVNINGALQRMASDEYFVPSKEVWDGLFSATQRNIYIWKEDVYEGETNVKDWDDLYRSIFYANSILEELDRIGGDDQSRIDDIQGRSLFIRAYALLDLANTFAPFYDLNTASKDLGVPIRLTADINQIEKRATVQQCYDRIIADLTSATRLLMSDRPQQLRTRPSKTAAYAMLARVYLHMADYEKAFAYADSSLRIYSNITDFNTIDLDNDQPFRWNNDDVIYYATQVIDGNILATAGVGPLTTNYIGIDTSLIALYDNHDLRPQAFFGRGTEGRYYRKMMYGSTAVDMYPFVGLATDEVYLIKAECAARIGELKIARETLQALLENRFLPRHDFRFENLNKQQLIDLILSERRKELVWRSARWNDLKRLAKDGRDIVIERVMDGERYVLEPESPRYVFPIPENEIIHLR